MKLRQHVKAYTGGFGLVGVGITVLAFAQPDASAWMHDHSAIGWLMAGFLLTMTLGLIALLDTQQREAGRTRSALNRALAAQQMEVIARGADAQLLAELLGPWRQGCDLMDWLKYSFVEDRVPLRFANEMEERYREWDNDLRCFADADVQSAFDRLKDSVREFRIARFDNMWMDRDYPELRVPPEWEMQQRERWESALERIGETGLRVLDAMQTLFALVQAKRLALMDPVRRDAVAEDD